MNKRRQEVHTDRFPILDIPELSLCLKSCNLNAPEEDLFKPSAIFVQSLFLQIIDIFLSIPSNKLRLRQKQVLNNEERDEFEDSLSLTILQNILYKFFVDCGVYDFIITDLIKPESSRIKRLLSAVVNFARFREEHLYDNEDIIQENNLKLDKYSKVLNQNKNFIKNIEILEKNNNKINVNLNQLNEHNFKVEQELKDLKKIQENLTLEHFNYKSEKQKLIQNLEDLNYLLLESRKELEKLKKYISESPEILNKIINDMNNSLIADSKTLSNLEIKSRKLSISIESFQIIQLDIKNCLKIIQELNQDLNKENSIKNKINSLNENLQDKNLKLNELNRKIQLLTRQIKNIEEKNSRVIQQRNDKKLEFDLKMKNLNEDYQVILNENNTNEIEINEKKNYINSIQKKMLDLENSYKIEFNTTNLEIQKLNSHVKLYLDQIEEKLSL